LSIDWFMKLQYDIIMSFDSCNILSWKRLLLLLLILRGIREKPGIDVSLDVLLLKKMTDWRIYFITKLLLKVNNTLWWTWHIRKQKEQHERYKQI
jgi:hypothetical protein